MLNGHEMKCTRYISQIVIAGEISLSENEMISRNVFFFFFLVQVFVASNLAWLAFVTNLLLMIVSAYYEMAAFGLFSIWFGVNKILHQNLNVVIIRTVSLSLLAVHENQVQDT